VLVENLEAGLQPKAVEKRTAAQVMGFVHADVDAPGSKVARNRVEHLAHERVGFFLPDQQRVPKVAHALVRLPTEDLIQVGQSLNAAHKLDAQSRGIGIKFPQLEGGVAAALVAKVGLIGNFVGILQVEHGLVIAQERQLPNQSFR